MIGKALDENNDIFLRNGAIAMTTDGAEVMQHVRSRLLFYRGEWFLDITAGVPYFQEVFVKPANIARVESLIKEEILNTPGVLRLIDFSLDFDATTRLLNATVSAETTYGVINRAEVFING